MDKDDSEENLEIARYSKLLAVFLVAMTFGMDGHHHLRFPYVIVMSISKGNHEVFFSATLLAIIDSESRAIS